MQMAVPKGRANYEPNSLARAGEPGGARERRLQGLRDLPIGGGGADAAHPAESFAYHL